MGGRVTSKGHAVGCTDQGIFELILWAAGLRVVVKGVYPRHFSSRIFSGDEALEHTLQTFKTTARGARRDDMAGLPPYCALFHGEILSRSSGQLSVRGAFVEACAGEGGGRFEPVL